MTGPNDNARCPWNFLRYAEHTGISRWTQECEKGSESLSESSKRWGRILYSNERRRGLKLQKIIIMYIYMAPNRQIFTNLLATSIISGKNLIAGLNFSCMSHKKKTVWWRFRSPSLFSSAMFDDFRRLTSPGRRLGSSNCTWIWAILNQKFSFILK